MIDLKPKRMRTLAGLSLVCGLSTLLAACSTPRAPAPSVTRLSVPENERDGAYLGLPTNAVDFVLEEIKCEALVVDCFDMYCHICQTEAKRVNELYLLAQDAGLGDRIKFIGLGVGDTPLEVATFKSKFRIPFPVFPDRRASVARSLGKLKLPNLMVLRKEGGRLKVMNENPGVLLDPAGLLARIRADLAEATPHHWLNPALSTQATCSEGSRDCRTSEPAPVAGR